MKRIETRIEKLERKLSSDSSTQGVHTDKPVCDWNYEDWAFLLTDGQRNADELTDPEREWIEHMEVIISVFSYTRNQTLEDMRKQKNSTLEELRDTVARLEDGFRLSYEHPMEGEEPLTQEQMERIQQKGWLLEDARKSLTMKGQTKATPPIV